MAEYVEKLGEEPGIACRSLFNELLQLRRKWREFVDLFGTNEGRIALLNESAPRFFSIVQDEMFENCLMHLCRMTDRETVSGKRTLSVAGLVKLLPPEIQREAASLVKHAEAKTKFARDWRNKRLGHHDFDHTLADAPLAEASRKRVMDAMEAIHEVLALIHRRAMGTEDLWREPPIENANGAEALLVVIRAGLRRRKERREAFIRGELNYPDDDLAPL